MAKYACMAIGIARAEKPTAYLPGAINGAREFAKWARASGYDTELLDDGDEEAITVEMVSETLTGLIARNSPVERLILYFAGHGIASGVGKELWLTSNWKSAQKAIHYNLLVYRLSLYNIKNVTIVSDACSSLPTGPSNAQLTEDGVLGWRDVEQVPPKADLLKGTSLFKKAFMLPGTRPADSRCIFSGALMEALWGHRKEAFTRGSKRQINNFTLAAYLDKRLPDLATTYGLKIVPEIVTGVRPPDNVYVDPATRDIAASAPSAFVWPPPGDLDAASQGFEAEDAELSAEEWPAPTVIGFTTAGSVPDEDFLAGLEFVFSRQGLPVPVVRREGQRRTARRRPSVPKSASAGREKRARLEQRFREEYRSEDRPIRFETRAGFAMAGDVPKQVVAPAGIAVRSERDGRWWRVGPDTDPNVTTRLERPVTLMVKLGNGRWAPVPIVPGFISTVSIAAGGVASLVLRVVDSLIGDPKKAALAVSATEAAVARLRAGPIKAGEAQDLAATLRVGKHVDPVRGVIAAHLYAAIGDVDSIRRMAAFYIENGQPIPYDIALLGQLRSERTRLGIMCSVPAVEKRAPETAGEKAVADYFGATWAGKGVVAGICPWLTQGWAMLDPAPPLVPPLLSELSRARGNAPFTTLDAKSGARLAGALAAGKI